MADKRALMEIWHPLDADERHAELNLLAEMAQRSASFVGTRREGYDAMTAETPMAEGVVLEAVEQDDIRGWWVRPTALPVRDSRAILFVHGGAYSVGSAKAYCGLVSQIAVRVGVAAFVLDYPLAPENPFPAAYNAGLAVRPWLGMQNITEIALIGDSAGGGLALATLGATEEELMLTAKSLDPPSSPTVVAVVVFSPWTDLALTGSSFNNPGTHDPVFRPERVAGAAAAYLGPSDPRDGRASPLYRIPDVLPPLFIQVGTDELLLDDARRYAVLAAEKGGEVRLDIFEGLHHVFQRRLVELSSARRAIEATANFLSPHWA